MSFRWRRRKPKCSRRSIAEIRAADPPFSIEAMEQSWKAVSTTRLHSRDSERYGETYLEPCRRRLHSSLRNRGRHAEDGRTPQERRECSTLSISCLTPSHSGGAQRSIAKDKASDVPGEAFAWRPSFRRPRKSLPHLRWRRRRKVLAAVVFASEHRS